MDTVMQRMLIAQTPQHVGETVKLAGWVHVRRDHGKLIFIDLRDRSGMIQMVVIPDHAAAYDVAKEVRSEYVIEVEGKVKSRPGGAQNEKLSTGGVEVEVDKLTVLSRVEKDLPFEVNEDTQKVNEALRLKYRYLDLRTERMQRNVRMRDKIITFFRKYMHDHDFVEIETPIMMKGTPEGSREYLVPSRIDKGKFYVLPQSPQQFKQLLMVAGFEKYFQIARCMRDEDLRGDRQPEFTQLDFEMSFVTQEDILQYTEAMFIEMVQTLFPEKKITTTPFPRLTYAESMEQYGSDKPDLREDKNDPNELAFAWIVDFPMFEKDDHGKIAAAHHPFCSVKEEDKERFMKGEDLLSIRANAYDLVLNGYELSSGSIRIHQSDVQKKVFELLGIGEEEQQARFGHMLEAFKYGTPPHGGFAPGIDRTVMLMLGEPNIREVIAFPKSGEGRDLMMNAPAEVSEEQLRELGICKRMVKKV
jgi:aspartyl-tRNA synthetase